MVSTFLQTSLLIVYILYNKYWICIGVSGGFRSLQNEKHFKLIADSVEGLRTFLYELDMEGISVPENLISALENFIVKIEPEEYNFIVLNNDSKIKLFKDCESYPDRIQKEEDNMSLWEEKDSKSIAQGNKYFRYTTQFFFSIRIGDVIITLEG